jgi:hypothetical protein
MMGNPHDFADGRAVTHDAYVPALDGLRGLRRFWSRARTT